MHKRLTAVLALTCSLLFGKAQAAPTDLFISEYVEGSSYNKALEIYNGTGAAIDLSVGQYVVQIYYNGSTSATTISLSGTVASGAVFVIANTSASLGTAPVNQWSGSLSFNGNDAVVLRKGGSAGTVLDVIGQVGFDPGTEWGTGLVSTADNTIRRKSTVCQGDPTTSNTFTPSTEWDGYNTDTFTGLGSHSASCGTTVNYTLIPTIQGSGTSSTLVNTSVTTEGVVTADFQGTNELGGFYIQEPAGDGNTATSDGIFVVNTSYAVNKGDRVRLTGTVAESSGRTQIGSLTSLTVLSTGNSIAPTSINLPVASLNDWEKYEGMLVTFPQTLTVTDNYDLGRYGTVEVSANGRLITPTNQIDPNDNPASGTSSTGTSNVSAVTNQQSLNDRSNILLDDKSSVQDPATVPYVDAVNNTLRCGSTIANMKGVVDYYSSLYRIQPTVTPSFTYAARPSVPAVGGYNVKVASMNVLNYFNGDGTGGGFPTSRGASTATEFSRQRTKIIEALKQMNADVIGLMEMENDGDGSLAAITDLVNGLNSALGATVYVKVPAPTAANGGTGTDEIKVAMIYKPSVVTPLGASIADGNTINNRPPLAQTFTVNSNGAKFSVIVNHLKSKGCTGATGADLDQNDGQSCFNDTRKQQAVELISFINTVKAQAGDGDVLCIGDYNSYEQEDPLDILAANGLTNQISNSYSFVFNGQSGSLDHAWTTPTLNTQITGAAKWHINCDEPHVKDYNQEFNPAYMYSPDAFRSSDHDPVLIGLSLSPTAGRLAAASVESIEAASIWPNPASGNSVTVKVNSSASQEVEIVLLNSVQQELSRSKQYCEAGESEVNLTLPVLEAGIYFVNVLHDGKSEMKKLVINK